MDRFARTAEKPLSPKDRLKVDDLMGCHRDRAFGQPADGVLSLVSELKGHGYRLGLLSNCHEVGVRSWPSAPLGSSMLLMRWPGYRRGMSDPLRLAVVGVGRMGTFHAEALAPMHGIDVVAVADVRPDAAREVGARIGAASYSSLDGLAGRDDVEGWLIASPTTTHPAAVSKALDAGVHVLCEKPLSLDVGESEALAERARHEHRVLQIGFWRRFSPPWVRARQAVVDGVIGRPIMLRLSQWDADPPPASFCDPATSGGLAIDCGVHEFDLISWITGLDINTVTARFLPLVDKALGEIGDVDNLVAMLDLSGGAAAVVDLSRNCRYGDDVRTEILGEDGAVFVDLLPTGQARLANARGVEVIPGSQVDDAFAAGIRAQAVAFAAVVRGGSIDFPDASASSLAVAVGWAVRRSGATGVSVDVAF